ncbi:acyl-coenzyme A diphosphatase FITM2-like [Diadema antillarum]|uniref:acyl-coenzyme A diphosphatase FITM2-like n=1 Tax=Diadema antillarum TaxID=105358 RepID=UPI003A8818E7
MAMDSRQGGGTNASRRKNVSSSTEGSQNNDTLNVSSSGTETRPKKGGGQMKRLLSSQNLAVLISLAILIGSVLRENGMILDSYFSNKHNVLNQKFVKWSWGWTLCFMTPYLLLLSWARFPGQIIPAVRSLLRLAVLTASWYFWVEIIMFHVHENTGACSIDPKTHRASLACRRAGGAWDGFDISGHSFLLVLIILSIHEELAPFWQHYESPGLKFVFPNRSSMEMEEHPILSVIFKLGLYATTIVISLMQSLSVIMVIATSLYFHTMSHKVLGTAIALLTWFATYRVWFISDSLFALPLS